jgi:hypothetical protein
MSQAHRFLAFLAATMALALVAFVMGPRLLGLAAGPEVELVTRLKTAERAGLELPVGSVGTLHGTRVSFQRLSVVLDADGQGATVTSTLDFTGNLERTGSPQRTRVSSLGLERARYRLREGSWLPETTDAPRLCNIVLALEGRRVVLDSSDPAPDAGPDWLHRRAYTAEAWFIRSERGEVLVSEDFRLVGELPDRPVDEKGTRRMTLEEGPGGMFNILGTIR